MKEYFKEHWKWLCISLVFPLVFTVLTFFLNNEPLGNLITYTITFFVFAFPVLIVWLLIGSFRKSFKLPITLILVSILSVALTYGYTRVLGPRYYTESETGITINGFQRHRLNIGAKKIKQINHAIGSNNHSETESAKSNAKYLNDYVSKHSNSNSLRSLSSYSYKTLKSDLGSSSFDSDDTADSNALRNLTINYGRTVLEQHNTEQEMISDNGKSLREFMNITNQ
ncbi:hypothetical protein [Companilactobacillus mindensis]|nr:hypothetical protein [Companilactobacillus mindensis]GEO78876.1 hypothetical protein LMI01_12070 [Companilactobacillus mindensis]